MNKEFFSFIRSLRRPHSVNVAKTLMLWVFPALKGRVELAQGNALRWDVKKIEPCKGDTHKANALTGLKMGVIRYVGRCPTLMSPALSGRGVGLDASTTRRLGWMPTRRHHGAGRRVVVSSCLVESAGRRVVESHLTTHDSRHPTTDSKPIANHEKI